MAGMKASVTIERSVGEVFAFLLNPKESAPRMDPGSEELVLMTPEGQPGPGTTFIFRQRVLGRVTETKTHLTAVDPDRSIEFDAEIGPMHPHCRLSFEDLGGRTSVTFRGNSNPPGPLKIFTPLMNRLGQRNWSKRLSSAKHVLECPAR